MRPISPVQSIPFLLLVLFLKIGSANAQSILYDNSSNGGTNVYYQLNEYGDEIVLSTNTTVRVMTEFQFEYYGDFAAGGVETARLRVYKNDGPLTSQGDSTPGTVLYDSGSFSISPGYQTKSFSGLNITLPDDLTWTVQFSGLVGSAGDEAGLILRGPPSPGFSYDDFWMKINGSWGLHSWGSVLQVTDIIDVDGLVARLTSPTPDPVSSYLWARIPAATQQQIVSPAASVNQRESGLVSALNNILQGGVSIYEATRFSGVVLSPVTQTQVALAQQNPPPAGLNLVLVNRLLLDDAYPLQVASKVFADFAARITGAGSSAAAPTVSISRTSNNVVVAWSGTSVLQVATSINGTFQDIPSARNTYQFDPRTAPIQFWRLRN
jgi:hypothetical protein